MGSPSIPEDMVRKELEAAEKMGLFITHQKYSQEEHDEFTETIKKFNALYWKIAPQTWCNTKWKGVHILKPPTDLWIYQELIQHLQPDLIIETGTCYGGSAIFMRDVMNLNNIRGRILTIDIDHSQVTRKEQGIEYYLGSSVDAETVNYVKAYIASYVCERVMVILDSDHSEEHVRAELDIYAKFVSVGMPLIVEDTNNHPGPKAAVESWFPENSEKFKRDYMCEKYMLTFNRDGYFERTS